LLSSARAEQPLLGRAERHECLVVRRADVLATAQGVALRRQHADHPQRLAFNAHGFQQCDAARAMVLQ